MARHFIIRGRVQGVGFRAWVMRRALELGVEGWVRNARDGSVEAVVAAAPEPLERFAELLRRGPPLARVDELIVTEDVAFSGRGFDIR